MSISLFDSCRSQPVTTLEMAEILMKEIDNDHDGGGDDVADDCEDDGDGKVAGNFGLDFFDELEINSTNDENCVNSSS